MPELTIYEKNIKSLKKLYPDFEFSDGYLEENKNFHVKPAKSGAMTIEYKDSAKTMLLHSRFDPADEGIKFAEYYKSKIEAHNVIVIFGMGFAYSAKAFLNIMNPSNMILLYEPSWEIFEHTVKTVDISDILGDGRAVLLIGKDYESIHKFIKEIVNVDNYLELIYTANPVYKELFADEYKAFSNSLLSIVKAAKLLSETMFGWGAIWSEAIVNNVRYMLKSKGMKNFDSIFEGRPVIVVAAGPSLDKNVHLLEKVKDQFVIVCVYTALKVLLKHSITPDFIITVDSHQTIYEPEDDKKAVYNIPIVFLGTTNSNLLERCTGGKVYCKTEHEDMLSDILPEKRISNSTIFVGGSVTISALHFAYFIGGNPVVMIGLDLAYTDNKSHATGTFYDGAMGEQVVKTALKDGIVYVDGVNGEKIKTDILFEDYIRNTENLVAGLSDSINFIDATEGGALIRGTQIKPLQEVINDYSDIGFESVSSILDAVFSGGYMYDENEIKEIAEKIKIQKQIVKKIHQYTSEGTSLSIQVEELFLNNALNEEFISQAVNKFYELDDKINALMDQTALFANIVHRMRFQLDLHQPDQETHAQLYFARHSRLLYSNMESYAKAISDAIENLDSYMDANYK